MTTGELDLIQRAQKGNADAFSALFDQHYDAVYRYCYFRVRDVEMAQDLASDVFVRMVEKLDTFKAHGRPLLAWLYTIARNLIIDHQRKAHKFDQLPLKSNLTADAQSNPSHHAEQALIAECLMLAIEHLTEDQQQVILLKFVQEFTNAQVAHHLGKTEGAVKSLQHRALAALGRALEKERCYEN